MPRRMKGKRNRAPQRFIKSRRSPKRRLLRVIRAKEPGDSNPARKLRLGRLCRRGHALSHQQRRRARLQQAA